MHEVWVIVHEDGSLHQYSDDDGTTGFMAWPTAAEAERGHAHQLSLYELPPSKVRSLTRQATTLPDLTCVFQDHHAATNAIQDIEDLLRRTDPEGEQLIARQALTRARMALHQLLKHALNFATDAHAWASIAKATETHAADWEQLAKNGQELIYQTAKALDYDILERGSQGLPAHAREIAGAVDYDLAVYEPTRTTGKVANGEEADPTL